MKRSLSIIIAIGLILSGCNYSGTMQGKEPVNHVKRETSLGEHSVSQLTNTLNMDVSEEGLTSRIIYDKREGEYHFFYEIQNYSVEKVILSFPSGQRYDYIIRDEEGKKVIQHSNEMMYTQSLGSEIIEPAETLRYKAMATGLKKGTYVIEMWLTTSGETSYKQKQVFEVS